MKRTTYSIPKMDCAAEEQLVRLRLQDLPEVAALAFDLQGRTLAVTHSAPTNAITLALESLELGAQFLEEAATSSESHNSEPLNQRRLLGAVFAINFGLFVIELAAGVLSKSMGLLADSLDMLADASVFALSFLAVGRSTIFKSNVARTAGYLQLLLALLGFTEVIHRFLRPDQPEFRIMIAISAVALIGNAVSLLIMHRMQGGSELHIRASVLFLSNDVLINVGVILAAILVAVTSSAWPDLIIGSIVLAVVIAGCRKILRLARKPG